jgi:hypothetical protein
VWDIVGKGPTYSALLLSLETLNWCPLCFLLYAAVTPELVFACTFSSLLLPRLLLPSCAWTLSAGTNLIRIEIQHTRQFEISSTPPIEVARFHISENIHPKRCFSCIFHASTCMFYMYPYRILLTDNIRLVSAVFCKNNKNLILSALSRVYGCKRFDSCPKGN